jgi:hypothetical protein
LERVDRTDDLYRRLVGFHINPDGTVNSAAFKLDGKPDGSISVDLARLTTPERCLAVGGKPELGVGALRAEVPLDLGFAVRHDPQPENEAHALIEGEDTKAKCRQLAEKARVIIAPKGRTS